MKKLTVKQAMKIYQEKFQNNLSRIFTPLYMLAEKSDGTGYALTYHHAVIPSREEWEVMKVLVDDFYENISDIEIEQFNDESRQMNNEQQVNSSKLTKKQRKIKGYIYFLKADNGLIKIGKTKDLKQRLDHFTAKLPYKLELLHSIESDDYSSLEEYFHEMFANKRKRGEWFELTEEDMKEVKLFEQ
ncbi:hypothetical protein COL30_11835 [Bacillus pseudomycoides]|uniref:GIY-YIG nuclease family protein n=1 Tax=Bacillus pseudomycoides TaxID=64104 RepID=UPI000BEE2F2D|nr:GIY-YIG nuclease family protein [Bacillus pseudomycoides]PED73034.1 hypothetical protein CON97_05340 [Bacillus pseudomycoides]PFW79977.1 hypothetical protein COL30_11835 [Bacillus pseudomycoides]PFZ49391.1 hypothetical protein COL56_24615 [Bacillus pseudomycoides]PHE48732.1 hypothetical protein COF53_11465 [Bacillus pseudomycoides]